MVVKIRIYKIQKTNIENWGKNLNVLNINYNCNIRNLLKYIFQYNFDTYQIPRSESNSDKKQLNELIFFRRIVKFSENNIVLIILFLINYYLHKKYATG